MAGNASDIEIIFGAKDFSDFIDKVSLIKTLSNCDKELIDEINVKLEKITAQKESLEADKTELEEKQSSLEADQAEFNTLLEKNKETLSTLYASNESAKNALEDAEFESAEIEKQIKAYYQSLQNSSANKPTQPSTQSKPSTPSNSGTSTRPDNTPEHETPSVDPPSSSGYVWPAPGYYYRTSEWEEDRGYLHGGIDIAVPMGASIVAADSGTVAASFNGCPHNWGKYGSCGCGGGYGNYVFIDHGNGKMTVYGHLTNAIVSTGQSVSQGQTIGYGGSTGNSTGPHLHYECRYNGVRYNPRDEHHY